MLYHDRDEPITEQVCQQARMRLNATAWQHLSNGTLDPMALMGHACADMMIALGEHLIAAERNRPLPDPANVPIIGEIAYLPIHDNEHYPNEGTDAQPMELP